jgi:hypothetical protein
MSTRKLPMVYPRSLLHVTKNKRSSRDILYAWNLKHMYEYGVNCDNSSIRKNVV